MKKGWYWPWIIIALLVATAAGQGVMLYAATHDSTFSLEPDYYKKAVAFDTVMAQERENATLGWTASATIGANLQGTREVTLTLTDAAGARITDAHVRVTAIHNLEGDRHVTQGLTVRDDGRFTARLPIPRAGMWELRIDAMRGRERYTNSLRVDASNAPAPATAPTPTP